MAHLATADAASRGCWIERAVDPCAKFPIIAQHGRRGGANAAQVIMRRIDLRGERTGVKASASGQHRKASDASGAHSVKVGLAVDSVFHRGAAARMEQNLIAFEQPAGIRGGPSFEGSAGVVRQRLGVAAVIDGIVEDRFAAGVAFEDVNQGVGLYPVGVDCYEAGETFAAQVADTLDDLGCMKSRLAPVELEIAVARDSGGRLVQHLPRVATIPSTRRASDLYHSQVRLQKLPS